MAEDITTQLPASIQRTLVVTNTLNSLAATMVKTVGNVKDVLLTYMNFTSTLKRDVKGVAESFAVLSQLMQNVSVALQIQVIDNGQPQTFATNVNPFPLTTPNTRMNLNAGSAEALRLARLTRFFSNEVLRLATVLYREAAQLQTTFPEYKKLTEKQKGAFTPTQPGYYVVKGKFDARDNQVEVERLPDIAEKLFGTRKNWQQIAEYNEIIYPYQLNIGQVLAIPNLDILPSNLPFIDENNRIRTLEFQLKSVKASIDIISFNMIEQFPDYESLLDTTSISPSRVIYTQLDPLGTDWYLDSVTDLNRGYRGATHDLIRTDSGGLAIRTGIDNFLLGMRRIFTTQRGHVILNKKYGHQFDEIVGNVKNARLQVVMARIFAIQVLQQESDRIEEVPTVDSGRDVDNVNISVTLVPKGYVNEFLLFIPIPELGGRGIKYVNRGIAIPAPENVRD